MVIIRIHIQGAFREFHVKVFNTGKLELPGIQRQEQIDEVIKILLLAMGPHCNALQYVKGSEETVLINSNFNCGFFIKRQVLYEKLRHEYNISSLYDPCTYPGIQSKIFFNIDGDISPLPQDSDGTRGISFMIFRTGSVLIVGKCEEPVLYKIYDFIKQLLHDQYLQSLIAIVPRPKKKINLNSSSGRYYVVVKTRLASRGRLSSFNPSKSIFCRIFDDSDFMSIVIR